MSKFDQKTKERLDIISNHVDGTACGCEYGCYGTDKERAKELLFEWTRSGVFGKKAFFEGLRRLEEGNR